MTKSCGTTSAGASSSGQGQHLNDQQEEIRQPELTLALLAEHPEAEADGTALHRDAALDLVLAAVEVAQAAGQPGRDDVVGREE
jgi:hypothetical protein